MNIKRVMLQPIALLALIAATLAMTQHVWAADSYTFGNQAIIVNTGSTNANGYRIYVSPDGSTTYIDARGERQGHISASLVLKFFRDIESAQPLNDLQSRRGCIRSASFSSTIYIKFGRQTSPDLSCAGDSQAQQLANDASAIRNALS